MRISGIEIPDHERAQIGLTRFYGIGKTNVKELAKKHKITRIVLITNAYHMKRSKMLFDKHFKEVLPFPTGYKSSRMKYDIFSYLPNAGNTAVISIAIKEYLGIIFYKITL